MTYLCYQKFPEAKSAWNHGNAAAFAGFLLASEIYVFIPGFLLQGLEIFFPSAEQSDFLLW